MSDVKNKVQQDWLKDQSMSKAQLARKHNISPRSVGRYIAELSQTKNMLAANTTKAIEKAKPAIATTDNKSVVKELQFRGAGYTDAAVKKLSGAAEDWKPEQSGNTDPEDWKPEDAKLERESVETDLETEESDALVEYRVLATSKSISITKVQDDKAVGSVVCDNTSAQFKEVFEGIKDSGLSQDYLAKAFLLLQPKEALKIYSQGRLNVDAEKNKISYTADDGVEREVHNTLAKRILDNIRENGVSTDLKSMMAFLDNLLLNPSYRAVQELYGFLEANDIKFTEDGHFIAWKAVRKTYFDKHSNTMDNSPGKIVTMPRNEVNENSNQTCSNGLHCCSKSYLSSFFSGGAGDCIVSVKVHPRDVVSIPTDYNASKMRTCRYEVIADVTKEMRPS